MRIAVSVCASVQNSGGVAATCYLRNLSTERKATEIAMEMFNFKRPLQAHNLPFQKVFQGRRRVQSDSFCKWNFHVCRIGFYCLYMLMPELDSRPKLTPTKSGVPCWPHILNLARVGSIFTIHPKLTPVNTIYVP